MTSTARHGFTIRIFLADGTSEGLRIVEKSNWTGLGVVCPRSQFTHAKLRDEFGKAGVYVLRGPSESGDLPTVYIREGDPARPRLEQHFAKKDFWTSLVVDAPMALIDHDEIEALDGNARIVFDLHEI
jgi:hypothetical protein